MLTDEGYRPAPDKDVWRDRQITIDKFLGRALGPMYSSSLEWKRIRKASDSDTFYTIGYYQSGKAVEEITQAVELPELIVACPVPYELTVIGDSVRTKPPLKVWPPLKRTVEPDGKDVALTLAIVCHGVDDDVPSSLSDPLVDT